MFMYFHHLEYIRNSSLIGLHGYILGLLVEYEIKVRLMQKGKWSY